MAKLRADPISQADLIEFLDDFSDFGFEVRVLRELIERDFKCQHGGTYVDPATGKPREFDIRAIRTFGRRILHLAVECKNLRENFPLLVSCVPRRSDEAFEDMIYSSRLGSGIFRLSHSHSRYTIQAPVGKSCDQVGRVAAASGRITAGDSSFYQKWAQALSSADELIRDASCRSRQGAGVNLFSLVFSLVVVPNGTLWQCEFDASGRRVSEPTTSNHISYFVGKAYACQSLGSTGGYTMSHVHFMTLDGLVNFVESFALSGTEEYFLNELLDESIGREDA